MSNNTKAWEKATKKLLKSVYDTQKFAVYYLCHGMTGSEELAESLTVQALEAVWDSLSPGTLPEAPALGRTYLQKALELCRGTEINTGNVPQTLPFWYGLDSGKKELFALRYLVELSGKEIATVLNQPVRKITGACTALDNQLAALLQQKSGVNCGTGAAIPIHIRQNIVLEQNNQTLPPQMNTAVLAILSSHSISAEGMSQPGRGKLPLLCVIVGVVLIVGGILGYKTLFAGSATTVANYYAEIVIEDYGTITVALDGSAAPETVANFVSLAESGFYDGLTFHRIIEGFMMQGGDPNGDGTGGSENTIIGEFSDNGFENDLSHTRGAISMARSTDYDSASSQFFICQEDSTYLDGSYACFGYVTDGLDIVDAICSEAEPTDSNGSVAAEEQPVITTIRIYTAEEYEG